MIVIETVPIEDTELEWNVTYFNDWFYNRPFHPEANVPVPGTYETPDKWRDRFIESRFVLIKEEDLGIDVPVIQDRHYKFVLLKG